MAMGRRASCGVSAPGARLGRPASAAAQPVDSQCRRLEHGERRTVLVDRPYTQEAVPGYRQIVDLSPANNSRFIDAVGQSGHFLSRHYDDFMTDWRDVRDRKMRMTRAEIDDGALGRLVLTPEPTN